MKFKPKSKDELKAEQGLLTEGEADFEIVKATDEKSKTSGADMIKVQLKVWDKTGKQGMVFDYITQAAHWKLLHLLEAIGKADLYETGEVTAQSLVGGSGKLDLKLQADKTGQYGDKMVVKDYHRALGVTPKAAPKTNEPPDFDSDEDIPF